MKPSRIKTPARTPAAASRLAHLQRLNSQNSDANGAAVGGQTEEVAVFCRVRPLFNTSGNSSGNSSNGEQDKCVEVTDGTTLQLLPPVTSRNFYNGRATQFSFKAVFDEESGQKSVFDTCGLPLVKALLQGRNGLLFTYGVTGSGKTHTMQGSTEDGGIMSRAIDVIFNSIERNMTPTKFLLVPDHLNDFQIQSAQEANIRQRTEAMNEVRATRGGYATRSNTSNPNLTGRMTDDTKLNDFDHGATYAVFISYCEIYNKYIYDLLEDTKDVVTGKQKFTSKILREDSHGNMYVHGATEVEVRSPKEALETFYRGQKRRRVAETQLNHESSRSHSVFNIRLVRCSPSKEDEGEIDYDKACVVSQLALVDLAGSERTSRTGNTGDRLREAGNINNSLMNLRNCIEKLRENQKSGKASNVPYRNDKMTHLFRNYFEGIGSVKMIICVNPKAADYDETMNVLQFAEMAQEIEIERFDPIQRNFAAMTPARQKVQDAYMNELNRAKTDVDEKKLNPNHDFIYSLGPALPPISSALPPISSALIEDDEALAALERHVDKRLATRNTLFGDLTNRQELFRQRLVDMEKQNILLKEENKRLKVGYEEGERRVRELENRLVHAEANNESLSKRVDAFCVQKEVLERELDDKEDEFNKHNRESKHKLKKLKTQLSKEQERRKRSYEEDEFRGVGSRIAEMEAKCTVTTKTIAGGTKSTTTSKKFRL